MENEVVETETPLESVSERRYSWRRAVLGLFLLPALLFGIIAVTTIGLQLLQEATQAPFDRSVAFLLSSGSFFLAAVLYILLSGRIYSIWAVLKLRNFKWWYTLVGLAGATITYLVAILIGMIGVLLTQLNGPLGEKADLGQNSTSETIGDLSQSHSLLFLALLVAVLTPIAEEIFFRGALLGSLVQDSKRKWIRFGAVLVVSVIFALFHTQAPTGTMADVTAVVTPGLVGLTAAILTLKFDSLYPAIFTHFFYNGAVLLIIAANAS